MLLEGDRQLLPHHTHVDGQVGTVEGHKGGQRLLRVREEPPDLDHVVYSGEKTVQFITCRKL